VDAAVERELETGSFEAVDAGVGEASGPDSDQGELEPSRERGR
jgi:hypothetical protein